MLLLDHCGWPGAFTQLTSDDGVTPFHLAFQLGHYALDGLLAALGGLRQGAAAAVLAAAAAAECCGAEPCAAKGGCCRGGDPNNMAGDACAMAGCPMPVKGAGAGAAAGGPAELDACEQCASTLPPLLLSIAASCADCGRRRMCLGGDAEAAAAAGRALADGSGCASGCGGPQAQRRVDTGELCGADSHRSGTLFAITALCQGCHANRVIAVA